MSKEFIVTNQVRCTKCGDTPFSATVHDFRACKCGSICVDGGQEYLRRVGDLHTYEDMSIIMDKDAYLFTVKSLQDTRDTVKEDDAEMMMMAILHSLLMTNSLTVTTWNDVQRQLLTYFRDNVMDAIHWALDSGRNNHGIVNAVIRAVNSIGFFKNKE